MASQTPDSAPENQDQSAGTASDTGGYNANRIKSLDDVEHVRARPGMYIGGYTRAACSNSSVKSSITQSTKPWRAMPSISKWKLTPTAHVR